MQVDTSVAEADVGKLQRRAWRRPSPSTPIPSERFAGSVRQIRNAPQTVQNVVTYDAVIDVDNPELEAASPGMTANVTFVYAERKRRAARAQRGAALPARPRLLAERMPAAAAGVERPSARAKHGAKGAARRGAARRPAAARRAASGC